MASTVAISQCQLGGLDSWTPFLVAIQVLVAITAILGNSLVVVAVVRFPVLRSPTNCFVMALALADLVVGLNVPFYISFYFSTPYVCQPWACLGRYCLALWTTNASMLLLTGAAVDRYVSIMYPLRYPLWVNTKIAIGAIISIGCYVTLVTVLPLVWEGVTNYEGLSAMPECDLVYVMPALFAGATVGINVLGTLIATTILYCRIFREAWKQNRAIAAMHAAFIHREARTAKMMVLILGVTFISLFPYLVTILARYGAGNDASKQQMLSDLKKVVVIFYFGKSAVNPFVYGYKNREFRTAFTRLLGCLPCVHGRIPRDRDSRSHTSQGFSSSIFNGHNLASSVMDNDNVSTTRNCSSLARYSPSLPIQASNNEIVVPCTLLP